MKSSRHASNGSYYPQLHEYGLQQIQGDSYIMQQSKAPYFCILNFIIQKQKMLEITENSSLRSLVGSVLMY